MSLPSQVKMPNPNTEVLSNLQIIAEDCSLYESFLDSCACFIIHVCLVVLMSYFPNRLCAFGEQIPPHTYIASPAKTSYLYGES